MSSKVSVYQGLGGSSLPTSFCRPSRPSTTIFSMDDLRAPTYPRSGAKSPGPGDHGGVDAADAHGDLAGGAARHRAVGVEHEGAVKAADLPVQLSGLERRGVEPSPGVAQVLGGQLPASAGAHAVAEGSLA